MTRSIFYIHFVKYFNIGVQMTVGDNSHTQCDVSFKIFSQN